MAEVTSPKYKRIADDIRQAIHTGQMREGHYLPSQKELVDRYGVATGTVRQALSQLATEGWVEPRKGRGVFVRSAQQRRNSRANSLPNKSVGFVLFGHYSTIDPEAQQVLHGATSVLQRVGRQVVFRVFASDDEDETEQQLTDFLETVGALIITREVTPSVIEAVLRANVPVVRLDYRPRSDKSNPFSEVFCEAERSGHLAGQQLLMHGHLRTALYTIKETDDDFVTHTLAGVCRACSEYQVKPPQVFASPDLTSRKQAVRALIDSEEISGVIVIDDLTACRLIHEMAVLGAAVPETKSVISIGGLPREHLSEPGLARVNRGYFEMGAETARSLLTSSQTILKSSLGVSFEVGHTLRSVVMKSPN